MKTTFSASVVVVALMAGCSTMPNPFTVQPPSVTKISSTKYRIEFAVKDENEGGAILEKQASQCVKEDGMKSIVMIRNTFQCFTPSSKLQLLVSSLHAG